MARGSSTSDAVQLNLFERRGPAVDARSGRDRRAPATEARPGSWAAFTRALAETLSVLGDSHKLILERKPAGVYVHAAAGTDTLRLEAVSNHYLQGADRLDRARTRRLRQLGWRPPTQAPGTGGDGGRARRGSPNWHRDLGGEVDYRAAAELLVATLRDVYDVGRPGRLTYDAFDADGRAILLPALGIDLETRDAGRPKEPAFLRPKGPDELRAAVLAALRAWTGHPDLELDKDGDLYLRRRDVSLLIRVVKDSPVIDLFSTVLRGAPPDPELLAALNELNNGHRFVEFTLTDSRVAAYAGVDAPLFVPELLTRAVGRVADAVEAVRADLRRRFAGRIAFEGDPAPRPQTEPEPVN